jgi:hypothetical protein
MHDRSVVARQRSLFSALVTAAALALAIPAAALAQMVAHGVVPSEEVIDSGSAPLIVIVTAATPRPPESEVVGLDHIGEVVVYSPVPESMPGWRKLRGADIRYHENAQAPAPSITTHSWKPSALSRIRYHDGRSVDRTRIPYAQTDSAPVSQSWNPSGARFQPSRIRYHRWTPGRGDEQL